MDKTGREIRGKGPDTTHSLHKCTSFVIFTLIENQVIIQEIYMVR